MQFAHGAAAKGRWTQEYATGKPLDLLKMRQLCQREQVLSPLHNAANLQGCRVVTPSRIEREKRCMKLSDAKKLKVGDKLRHRCIVGCFAIVSGAVQIENSRNNKPIWRVPVLGVETTNKDRHGNYYVSGLMAHLWDLETP